MVAGFAFTSCSDDDGDAPAQQASITGKWYYAQQGTNFMGQDVGFTNYPFHTQGCEKDNMVLGTDNSYKEYEYETAATGCTEEEVLSSTYTMGNSSITFGTGASADTWEIESVTENTMRIRQAQTMEGQTYYEVQTYTRQQ
ncbi:hypothetical protein LRS05_01500 [Flavobacterium sp. J372]|uniref:hypothetical protein n=1 Tax=Flavobacterium sp. J372 TaxID=2898436 RepID=UPI002150B351|nr:hypothetical protein [Flavobacterium sp. J372]MCR5860898.1 hypothetical protein [Flavobacterium sp. J372]